MEMGDFFNFRSKGVLTTIQAYPIGLKRRENELNDRWNLIKGKYEGIDFPVIFKQDSGKVFRDILDTGWPSFFLISDRMKVILEENLLTGWKTFPIKLYDKKESEIIGYHGFSIIGKSGPVTHEQSEIIEKRYVPTGPICRFYKGEYVDDWDGSDFFTPDKTYDIFITRKAADILTKNNITNMRLENLAEIEIAIWE